MNTNVHLSGEIKEKLDLKTSWPAKAKVVGNQNF